MSLTYVKGDILTPNTSDRGVIVCHQVNCKGVMGAGLAKQVKDKHPRVYEYYREACKSGQAYLGKVQAIPCGEYRYSVANIFGQMTYGRHGQFTDYGALIDAFKYIRDTILKSTIIRIPFKMGCGLGGGNWDVVLGLIEDYLGHDFDVEIWRL